MGQPDEAWAITEPSPRFAVRERDELVVPHQFIQATRDAGYRSLAFALAELLDNALDAGASKAHIRIAEDSRGGEREITISVLDDGHGMDKLSLWHSLRFGGSARFGGRAALGRYGMGLPNSSLSQAPRVEVYTWRRGQDPLRTYLDVDEITGKGGSGIPEPETAQLPEGVPWNSDSGTLVQWSRCDRLSFKKASTLVRKIRPPLGRMYRLALDNGITITVNDEPLHPVDPLFRTPVEGLPGTSQRYGDPLEYRVRLPSGGTSTISVQFVELPISRWHDLPAETKRAAEIVGGAGMSVLRRGREIDYGWHLFGTKRRENYDDWWRCELRFEPPLDEFFGITHSKQGINPAPALRTILEPDLEHIARELNGRARAAFRQARSAPVRALATRAADRDRFLPALKVPGGARRRPGEGYGFDIGFHDEARREFFEVEVRDAILNLKINRNHAFYERLYVQAQRSSIDLDLLLLAAARALLDLGEDAREALIRSWSDNLLAYLDG